MSDKSATIDPATPAGSTAGERPFDGMQIEDAIRLAFIDGFAMGGFEWRAQDSGHRKARLAHDIWDERKRMHLRGAK